MEERRQRIESLQRRRSVISCHCGVITGVVVYRRVVLLLLLLPGLLLSQAAAAGHAHGHHTPAGHSARPHVHTSTVVADGHHAHGHHHGPGGHHHHHDDDEDESDQGPTVPTPQTVTPPPDHDEDAVFVSVEVIAVERPAVVGAVEVVAMWVFPDAQADERGSLVGTLCRAGNGRPPPDPACPLYVRHLALLM